MAPDSASSTTSTVAAAPATLEEQVLQCIHCGLCLPFCPTYAELGTETDSPRGRIYLARAVLEGRLRLTRQVFRHLDLCLDCRACQTACPSGVQYGLLLDWLRDRPDYRRARPLLERAALALVLRHLLPRAGLLRAAGTLLRVYQGFGLQWLLRRSGAVRLLPRWLCAAEQLLPPRLERPVPSLPEVLPPQGKRRARVALLSGCVMDIMLRSVNWATARVLAANGCEVVTPAGQCCCGALHLHQGELELARQLARRNIDVFEAAGVDAIIVNAAGCGSAMKEYPDLLRDDPSYADRADAFADKTRDVAEFLTELPLTPPQGRVECKVAYDEPCHLIHAQQITAQPRELLRAIPGVELVELKECDWCCGSAGIYNIAHAELADALLERKMDHIEAASVDVLASGNIGCLLQLAKGVRQRGLSIRVAHPVEMLDEAYEKAAVGG